MTKCIYVILLSVSGNVSLILKYGMFDVSLLYYVVFFKNTLED